MELFNKIQLDTIASITRARSNFKKSPKDRITKSYIEVRLESLEKLWKSFTDTHIKILREIKEVDYVKSHYYTAELFQTTDELYMDYKTELSEVLSQLSAQNPSRSTSKEKSEESCRVKLPKIALPNFSGNYSEWISFRDLFTSLIHNNHQLDNVQKLHYLKTHLSGEAEGLLRHVPITDSNYLICWSQLESRYNNKKYLANCILKRFMSQKNIVTESSSTLKELLDTSNECLHALRNLGIQVGSWDLIIIYILCLKLDNESRKQWEAKTSEVSDQLPTFSQFQSFLEQRFRSLEFLDNKGQCSHNSSVNYALTISCSFCQDEHGITNCKRFLQLDIDKRRKFAQTTGLCYNCLGVNHSVYSCHQSTRCRFCMRKHHTLLHVGDTSKPDNTESFEGIDGAVVENGLTAATTTLSQSKSTNVVSCFSNNPSQVLLATALVKAKSRNGTVIVLRSLLDQGSQASFVTESAVQLLGLQKIPNHDVISGIGGGQSLVMTSNAMVVIKVQSRLEPSFVVNVKAYVLKNITTVLPKRKMMAQVTTISPMELADPCFINPNKIDLLLGAEVYGQILLEGFIKGPPGSPIAQNTKLGWILSGRVTDKVNHSESNHSGIVSMHSVLPDEVEPLKGFGKFRAECTCNNYEHVYNLKTQFETLCSTKTYRDESERYTVPIRSSDPSSKYVGSKNITLNRFLVLEKRFLEDPNYKKQYSAVINEYLSLSCMVVIPDDGKDSAAFNRGKVRNDQNRQATWY